MSLGTALNVTARDFYPSRTSLNLWWGFAWRTLLFSLLLGEFYTRAYIYILHPVAGHLIEFFFNQAVYFMIWKEQNPAVWFLIAQLISAVFVMLPAMALAWWWMLSCPVFRTYTLRHLRQDAAGEFQLAHGFRGACHLALATFLRLAINFLPLYLVLYALQSMQVTLMTNTLADLPYFQEVAQLVMLVMFYLYLLTIHHMLHDTHKGWSLRQRPHKQSELLEAFVPTDTAAEPAPQA